MSGEGMRAAGYPHGEVDARQWAEEFVRIFPDARPDRDTLLGWFANAIMTGYDRAKSEERAAPERGGLEPRNAQIDGAALAVPSTPEPSGLRAKVEGLPSPDPTFPSGYYTADMVSRAAVLALLDGAAPSTEPALDSERCAECSRTIKHSFTCPRVLREVNRLREASAT